MTTVDVVIFGAIVLCGLGLSAMFSGLETGLYTINRVRLAVRAGHGERRAERIRAILRDPTRMLATLLIANNIANYLSSFGIASLLDRAGYSPATAIVLNAAVLIPLLFVFGEILPKDLFRTHTDHWTYGCSLFLRITQLLLTWSGLVPIVRSFGRVVARMLGRDASRDLTSRQRMSRLIKEGTGAGLLSEVQATLADRAMVLRERSVRDEMVAWREVVTLRADATRAAVTGSVAQRRFTRYPVVDPSGAAIGVVSMLDLLLDPSAPAKDLAGPLVTLEPDAPVREALRAMRDQKAAMAIVTRGSGGRPLGIVTLKDLVEPLTGELASW